MSQTIDITINQTVVGMIVLDEAPAQLTINGTATGFALSVPALIRLKLSSTEAACPMLSNLSGTISAVNASGVEVEIARVRDDSWYVGAIPESNAQTNLIWLGTLPALALFERIRNAKPPRIKIELRAEACYLLPSKNSPYRVRTEPSHVIGAVQISYPTNIWLEMLRKMGAAENVLVEIPLPGALPAPWSEVLQTVIEARDAFEQGGSTGWKACVTSVRLALEQWRKFEPEDQGPGWKMPSQEDRNARTKEQRLNNLRWHLLQCAHLAPHSVAEIWSRDDALLMLSTLSGLMNVRKP